MKSIAYSNALEMSTYAGPVKVVGIKVISSTEFDVKLMLLVHKLGTNEVLRLYVTTDKVVRHSLKPDCDYLDLWDWYFYPISTHVRLFSK